MRAVDEMNDTLRRICEESQKAVNAHRYYFGLDLGQSQDFSALALLEPQARGRGATYHCRYLKRWPLRTPYPEIVVDVAKLLESAEVQQTESRPVLAVDATGVGAPVVDLFKRAQLKASLQAIQITGGDQVTRDSGLIRVPKRDLVSVAQVALQTERLKIASALPEAAALTRELSAFQVRISLDTAHDSYGAWREGTHDDGCWGVTEQKTRLSRNA